jgi:hypothetical protein
MSKFDTISDADREVIARGAAPFMNRLDSQTLGAPGSQLILGPSLREEMLTLGNIEEGTSESRTTGQTLSIISAPSNHPAIGAAPGGPPAAVGYVRSGPKNNVTSVSSSDLSNRIEKALKWIDDNVQGNPLVRVLTIPAYQSTALSLYENEKLSGVVVVTPPQGPTSLRKETLYDPASFLEQLRTARPAQGLNMPPPAAQGTSQ